MPKPRTRGNKQGSIYYRKDRKCWIAQIIVGWRPKENGKLIPIKKTVGGYKTKKEALVALNKLLNGENPKINVTTLDEVYKAWQEFYKSRVSEQTLKVYECSYNYYAPLKYRRIETITSAELQKCMDDCPKGKRTHEVMKVLAGLLWSYAIDNDIVRKDVTRNLYIGKHETTHREPLTQQEVELVRQAIGKIKYADYVYCLCYLGYRPGEFLEIKKNQVMIEIVNKETIYYIVEGRKTEAGKNRKVIVPKQILSIVKDRLKIEGTDLLFPMYCYQARSGKFLGFKQMDTKYFSAHVFKKIMDELGIEGKVPYSTRHTYANKLKAAEGDSRDKAALMGHTDYSFTQAQYQSSPLEDLKIVVDSIE